MPFKPADFFLGVVNFIGDLVPGAILLSLLLLRLSPCEWQCRALWPRVDWLIFGVAAYVAGQLLLAVSELLNDAVDLFSRLAQHDSFEKLKELENEFRTVHRNLMWPGRDKEKVGNWLERRSFAFHTALSYVRLKNATAAAEVDHHMADYKLLRCLLVMLPVIVWVSTHSWWLQLIELALGFVVFLAFARMYNWARYFAFDYALQLSGPPAPSDKK